LTELVYCVTVALTNLLTFKDDFSFGKKKPEDAGSQIQAVGVLTDLGDVMFCRKVCMRAVEWAGALKQLRLSVRSVIVNATVTHSTQAQ